MTYLDVKFDSNLVNDLKEDVGKEDSESGVAEKSDKVPYTTVTFACQILQVDRQD